MAFTYSQDPTTSPLDEVRFLIGDTVSTDPMLQDAEINYLLVSQPAPRQAAISACRTLARKFARQPGSRSIGDVSISYADLSKRFNDLADQLKIENASSGFTVPTPSMTNTPNETAHFRDDDFQWTNTSSSTGEFSPDLTER